MGIGPTSSVAGPYSGPRLPPIPQIGQEEHLYAEQARHADEQGDRHAREAAKVGLYVTLAISPRMKWPDKLRHFTHALHKHCHTTRLDDPRVWAFYHELAVVVKTHCGQEALKRASHEDDQYAARLAIGTRRELIEREAKRFFEDLIGTGKDCPDYLMVDDFHTIKMIRDQWI